MRNVSLRVQRLYKNASGEILRIDEITISGYVLKKNAFWLGERPIKQVGGGNGAYVLDFGPDKFHSNPLRIETETYQTTSSRTCSEVEMIGGFDSLGSAPDYDSFTWAHGTIDISFLPGVGATL